MAALAEHLKYLDSNQTAYQELLAWKAQPLPPAFLLKTAASDIPGPTYGEAAHHGGGWLYDPCRLNSAIASKVESTRRTQCSDLAGPDASSPPGVEAKASWKSAVVPAKMASDGADPPPAWWATFTMGDSGDVHAVRLAEEVLPEVAAAQYCTVSPCAALQWPERHQQVLAELVKAHTAGIAGLEREASIGPTTVCEAGAVPSCCAHPALVFGAPFPAEIAAGLGFCAPPGSRNEGFFSNVLQAVDALLSCAARGAAGAKVVWDDPSFPYGSGGTGSVTNAWELYFEPVNLVFKPTEAAAAVAAGRVLRLVDYSRSPPQVPTQFERYPNSRLDNLHRPALTPADRYRIHRALQRLGVRPLPAVLAKVQHFAEAHLGQPWVQPGAPPVTIAVHYRGTDHWDELPGGVLVPVDLFLHTVHTIIDGLKIGPDGGGRAPRVRRVVVFVASDSDEAVGLIRSRLTAAYGTLDGSAAGLQLTVVASADVVRRPSLDDSVAIHQAGQGDGSSLGEEVLVDALLLARCDHLVHAQSNVAAFAAYSNPKLVLHYIGHKAAFEFAAANPSAAALGAGPRPRHHGLASSCARPVLLAAHLPPPF